jgi:hypothetical protein
MGVARRPRLDDRRLHELAGTRACPAGSRGQGDSRLPRIRGRYRRLARGLLPTGPASLHEDADGPTLAHPRLSGIRYERNAIPGINV